MPELPEVETVARALAPLVGSRLNEFIVNDKKVWFESEVEPEAFVGAKLKAIRRRGKYLIYDFESLFLLQHLRMTGKMLPDDSTIIPEKIRSLNSKQLRCEFRFDHGNYFFYDPRRFGTITAVRDLLVYFAKKKIAPDPIHEELAAKEHFIAAMKKTRRPVKSALLDQSIIAGVGNIYADEALFALAIHPLTISARIKNTSELFLAARAILEKAIEARGTTVYNYVNPDGIEGSYALELKVYGRTGEACLRCKNKKIQRLVIAGRSSHFCAHCQRRN